MSGGYGAHSYDEVAAAYDSVFSDLSMLADDCAETARCMDWEGYALTMDDVRDLEQRVADIHRQTSELRVMAARCGLWGLG